MGVWGAKIFFKVLPILNKTLEYKRPEGRIPWHDCYKIIGACAEVYVQLIAKILENPPRGSELWGFKWRVFCFAKFSAPRHLVVKLYHNALDIDVKKRFYVFYFGHGFTFLTFF